MGFWQWVRGASAQDREAGERSREVPAEAPPEPSLADRYLDPASTRGRIVVLLSEDGSVIEPPMWQHMGAGIVGKAQAASVLATAASTLTTELALDVVLACQVPVEGSPDGE